MLLLERYHHNYHRSSRADMNVLGFNIQKCELIFKFILFLFSGSSIGPTNVDSARQNLAASFVNGFVNAAFGSDKLLMEDGNKWLYKNKEHGKSSVLIWTNFTTESLNVNLFITNYDIQLYT